MRQLFDHMGRPVDEYGNLIEILQPGATLRTSMLMFDSVQKGVRGEIDQLQDNGQAAYEKRVTDAWKSTHHILHVDAQDPADNGQAAYEARITNAWRQA